MALKATIYKANLSLSDMDGHRYGEHSLTIARHPSETDERMMVRILAYALYCPSDNDQGSLEFAKGLWDVDEPDLWLKDLTGAIGHWVDVGLPDETRMKRTAARTGKVTVIAYAPSVHIWWEGVKNALTRLSNLQVLQLNSDSSQALAALAQRNMQIQVMIQDGTVWFNTDQGGVEFNLQALKNGLD